MGVDSVPESACLDWSQDEGGLRRDHYDGRRARYRCTEPCDQQKPTKQPLIWSGDYRRSEQNEYEADCKWNESWNDWFYVVCLPACQQTINAAKANTPATASAPAASVPAAAAPIRWEVGGRLPRLRTR